MTRDDDRIGGRIYVTFHRECLVAGRSCVRIRDRRSGRWGPVLPNLVLGSVPKGEADPEFVCDLGLGPPRIGERLCIQVGGERVISTPILAIEADAGTHPLDGPSLVASGRPDPEDNPS